MPDVTYLIPVKDTIASAWRKVYGAKGSFWAAMLLLIVLSIILYGIQALFDYILPSLDSIVGIVVQAIDYLLQMGIIFFGIQRAFDLPISYSLLFRSFKYPLWVKMIGLYILQVLIFIIPVLLLFIPMILKASLENGDSLSPLPLIISIILVVIGVIVIIILAIRLALSNAFVLDKQLGPVDAIRASFQATRGNFWRLLGIMIIQLAIVLVSVIPFGIGLIWTIPFAYILYGLVYKRLLVNVRS